MSEKNNGGTAFPATFYDRDSTGEYQPREQSEGMSLRDYFAAKAMQSLMPILKHDIDELCEGKSARAIAISEMAYMYADAMIVEREK